MVNKSEWGRSDKFHKFANNWKLIGVSSKVDFKEQHLIEGIMHKLLPLIRDVFGDEGLDVIKKAFFLEGVEKGQEILGTLDGTKDVSSCIVPLETVCMLTGIKSDRILEDGKITLHVFGCPYEGTIQDVLSKEVFCECFSKGLVYATNPSMVLTQPLRSCVGDEYCEFMIES